MKEIASYIDHTILKSDATNEEVIKVCKEAEKYNFASVCVNLYYIKLVSDILKDSSVKTTCVIGFPLGATTSLVKEFETRQAIKDGADEIDMVINIAALKNRQLDIVKEDIKKVIKVADGKIVKVIIETCLLTDEEKILSCEIAKACNVDFVKTSTGFSAEGANVNDVKLMKSVVGETIGVKASGGIKNLEDVESFIKAGANRIGASSSVDIMKSLE